ncbi:protein Star [Copidosoma floridanum]|uniref:protein Star n=1 Tax=Copidosoma floridanum TaxID=29053 RepID=UPI0006C978A1|nr:protein Star [Copidosoma floridanum]
MTLPGNNGPVMQQPAAEKTPPKAPSAAQESPTATTTTTTTTMAPSMAQGNSGIAGSTNSNPKKRCWRRRTVHFTVFLAVFSTILSLLWIYMITADIRKKAFDMNMMRDYVLTGIPMDYPQLVKYIRDIELKGTTHKESLNATQTPEERFVVAHLKKKRDGVYFEYMSRVGATTTTGWLEKEMNWRGLLVITDPTSFFDALRSTRNPKTKFLHAYLSTDKGTRVTTYHQNMDVQVMKLGEGPNSLGLTKEIMPATRLICYPLYSILLAYNTTTIDYLNLDSSEVQDGLLLDTIPWEKIRISVLAVHWNIVHHSEPETQDIIDKLTRHNYEFVKSLSTGKLIFVYNQQLKV